MAETAKREVSADVFLTGREEEGVPQLQGSLVYTNKKVSSRSYMPLWQTEERLASISCGIL